MSCQTDVKVFWWHLYAVLSLYLLMLMSSSVLCNLGECSYSDWRVFEFVFDCNGIDCLRLPDMGSNMYGSFLWFLSGFLIHSPTNINTIGNGWMYYASCYGYNA